MTEIKVKLDMDQIAYVMQENKVLKVQVKGIQVNLTEEPDPTNTESTIVVEKVQYSLASMIEGIPVLEGVFNDDNVDDSPNVLLEKKVPFHQAPSGS